MLNAEYSVRERKCSWSKELNFVNYFTYTKFMFENGIEFEEHDAKGDFIGQICKGYSFSCEEDKNYFLLSFHEKFMSVDHLDIIKKKRFTQTRNIDCQLTIRGQAKLIYIYKPRKVTFDILH